ncbi:hypothetical protein GCM10018953_32260 [Streptosporangium nondiastaticum]
MSRPFSGRLTRVSFRVARGDGNGPKAGYGAHPDSTARDASGRSPGTAWGGRERPGKPRVTGEGPREKADV